MPLRQRSLRDPDARAQPGSSRPPPMSEASEMLTAQTLKIGGRYNWRNQPERLVYTGLCEPRNGRWHQFALVDAPDKCWCEVLDSDLHRLEETQPDERPAPALEQRPVRVAKLTKAQKKAAKRARMRAMKACGPAGVMPAQPDREGKTNG